jgi:uncharacterized protein YeaO (DUF488 family)
VADAVGAVGATVPVDVGVVWEPPWTPAMMDAEAAPGRSGPGCAERPGGRNVGHVDVVRVYEDPGRSTGEHRVLVDRLWPRGVTKAAVDLDEWAKDVAPSTELRRWYGHDPGRFDEFSRRYVAELADEPAASVVAGLAARARRGRLVLLTATRDVGRSGAAVLAGVLAGTGSGGGS